MRLFRKIIRYLLTAYYNHFADCRPIPTARVSGVCRTYDKPFGLCMNILGNHIVATTRRHLSLQMSLIVNLPLTKSANSTR